MQKCLYRSYGIIQQVFDNAPEIHFADIGKQVALIVNEILLLDHLFLVTANHLAEYTLQRGRHISVTERSVAFTGNKVGSMADNLAIPLGEQVTVLSPTVTIYVLSNIRNVHGSDIQFGGVERLGKGFITLSGALVTIEDRIGLFNEFTDVSYDAVDNTTVPIREFLNHPEGLFCEDNLHAGFYPVF